MRSLQGNGGVILSIWLAIAPVYAGSMTLLGVGKVGAGATYQGPVDVASALGVTVTHFWSCSRAASAALASTATSLCDLVKTSDGTAVCTLRGSSTGYVDLAASYCSSTTPATACSNAGGCSVSKAYNQINAGTADMTNAGATSTKPTISFAALNGLPVTVYTSASSQLLSTSSTVTRVSPYSMSVVFNRATVNAGGYLSTVSATVEIRGASTANNMALACGTALGVGGGTITDSQWHAANSSCVTSAGQDALRVDATDNTSLTAGTTGFSGDTLQMGKSNGGVFAGVSIAETMLMSSALDATGRSNMNSNQHSSTNGYSF